MSGFLSVTNPTGIPSGGSGLPNIAPTVDSLLPSSVSTVVLSVYNARADKIAAANQANLASKSYNFTFNNAAIAADLATAPTSKTITLVLNATATPAQPAIARPTSPGSPGNPPTALAQSPQTQPTAIVTFDISPSGGVGFVQSISDRTEAHQSVHQTASGFYIDQFGMKPGELNIEAVVAFTSDVATQVQVFKDLLYKAKLLATANTVYINPPPRLLYTNSVDGRTLLLSQTELEVKQSAERPNMATVSIRATILTDYATPAQPLAPTAAAASVSATGLNLATNASGALVTTSPAVAGVAAQ